MRETSRGEYKKTHVNNDSTIQTNRTAKSLKEIAGIDVFDKQTGQVKDMNTILSEVAEKYKTLSKNQKLALAESIGGKTQINSVQALLNNWSQVAKFQQEYLNGNMVGSAAKENERYLDSIEGRMAKLKNSWDKLVTSLASSGAVKFGISGLDAGVSSIEKIVSALDKAHMTIPAAVASFALLKTAISSIKYAGGLTDGISMFVMKLGEIPAAVSKAVGALTALTGLSTGGLVLALGGVAAAMAGIYAIGKYVDNQNMKATNTYNKLTKSVNEHQKALSKAKNTETNFDSLIGKYEKLSNITNKSKEQQNEYNSVLKELEKINPNLIQYDDNGNAIKVRTGEVKEYREELQKTIKEYEKLLSMKLEEKANASYDKNNSQPEIQKRLDALQKAKDEMDLRGAIVETAKYPTKPIEKMGETEEQKLKVTDDLMQALRNKRQIGFGGLFREIRKELQLEDVEEGDLIHIDEDKQEVSAGVEIVALWNWGRMTYEVKE